MTANAWDLVVVGGGAAGYFAAISCAEHAAQPLRILIVEKASRSLGKVLISGGGRCNVTHACFEPARLVEFYPRGGIALRSAFTRFQPGDTVAWFEQHGVPLKTEADGRIFPRSDSAQTVVDCLLQAAQQAGVVCWTDHTVITVEHTDDPWAVFHLELRPGGRDETVLVTAGCLLLATGGDSASLRLAKKLGHTVEAPVPSLFTFTVRDARLEGLAGVSVAEARLTLLDDSGTLPTFTGRQQSGPLLITHWGLSGPAALRLSAWGARWLHSRGYRAGLRVNWLGEHGQEAAQAELLAYQRDPVHARQKAAQHSPFNGLPGRLWQRLFAAAGIGEETRWGDLSRPELRRLAEELTAGRYTIQGKGPFKEEFVTCGGVCLDEVDFRTMESKRLPGLYIVGEALDVDGLTGGFNFQNAWTTGWLAGRAVAERA